MPETTSRGKFPAIEEELRTEISKLDRGSAERVRLGSEAELSTRFNVARNTLRVALRRLAEEGLIYSEPTRGWFVGNKANAPATVDVPTIVATLRDELASENVVSGKEFATAPQIAKRFDVTLHAARQALIMLGAQGLIESRHGQGWFVSGQS